MKIYNVLFETNYEDEDIQSEVVSFKNREDAAKCLEHAIEDEIRDGVYDDEEVEEKLVRNRDGFFCFFHDSSHSNWKFRGKIFNSELL